MAEELGHAGEVGGVLQLAVAEQQVQDLALVGPAGHGVGATSRSAARLCEHERVEVGDQPLEAVPRREAHRVDVALAVGDALHRAR